MQNFVIFLYILFFSLISAIVWICLSKNRSNGWKSLVFFFFCNFFLMSAVKAFLGSPESTLFESFWDIQMQTYVHYGIPLLAFSVLAPIAVRLLFRKKAIRLILSADAFMFMALILTWILTGTISNGGYCVAFVVSAAAALLYTLCVKKEMVFLCKGEYRKYAVELLPVVCAWVVTVGIYLPNELYLTNYSEFSGSYGMFFAIMLLGCIFGGAILLMADLLFVPKSLLKIFHLLLAGIICMGYLQIMFLNGKLKELDGVDQIWSVETQVVNAVIWVVVIVAVVVIGYKKTMIAKVCKWVCLYIAAIQAVTLGVLLISTDYESAQAQEAMSTDSSLDLAQDGNVLVFVLDCFEGSCFEEIVEEDSSIIEPLADFTYYRNGTSQFAHTDRSIPYMLTGIAWTEEIAENYLEYAYANSDALSRIAENGYDIGIYTSASYLEDTAQALTTNYRSDSSWTYAPIETIKLMLKTSLYKMMPFALKPEYVYYSGDVFSLAKSDEVWSIENDIPFYNSLMQEGLTVNEELDKAFRFYHMRGPHAPFYLSEDIRYEPTGREATISSQGRGSLRIVYEYLEQMKALGIYDDATIIITADHGQGSIMSFNKTSGKPDKTSRPIFIIKKPGEHGSAMQVSNAPVSQAELMPTVLEAAGLDGSDYGRTFEEISEEESRERMYVDVTSYSTVQYIIRGDAAELENWDIKKAVYQE